MLMNSTKCRTFKRSINKQLQASKRVRNIERMNIIVKARMHTV